MSRYRFGGTWCIYPGWYSLSSWMKFGVCHYSRRFSDTFLSNIPPAHFSLHLVFTLHICYNFCNCPNIIGYLFSVFDSLHLLFRFRNLYCPIVKPPTLSLHLSNTLVSPPKTFYISVKMFFSSITF